MIIKPENMNKLFVVGTLTFILSCSCQQKINDNNFPNAILPKEYVKILGKGMDVDWAKTKKGIQFYNEKTVKDFKSIGLSHVRIRIKEDISNTLLLHIDKVVNACLSNNLLPIIAYQANDFKESPNEENLEKVVSWWGVVSKRYQKFSPKMSFDVIIEVTDALNKNPNILNDLYERAVTEIRKTNPRRIIFISPRIRSSPEYLHELKIPTKHNNYLMVEWHFYAAGPSKTNPKKLWTTGTETEKSIIIKKIKLAVNWQESKKIYSWVGAWMPSNYNDGNSYSVTEQINFAKFVTCELDKEKIPFAVNSDTKFYNRESNQWILEKKSLIESIISGNCK